ncbi:MAG: hypothetical protein EBR82_41940 [Caulobacteraceae bacterium]|nr:hypothetical protein [Caulobacteraceae bacterium]
MKLLIAILTAALTFGQLLAEGPRFPEIEQQVDVAPAPPVEPQYQRLNVGQYYVIASDFPMLVLDDGSGIVSVSVRTSPFMLPSRLAPGWRPQPEDPEFTVWPDRHIVALRAVRDGSTRIAVLPAVCVLDSDGSQKPITRSDVQHRLLLVGANDPDPPAPKPPSPPSPDLSGNPFGEGSPPSMMIVYESETVKDLPLGQYATIHGRAFRAFLEQRLPKQYRMYDQHVVFRDTASIWAKAMSRKDRKSLPWLYVGSGPSGLSIPLPESHEKAIEAVSKVVK